MLPLGMVLAFAVCVWGLQYKLSLYQFRTGRPAGPAAKLLSQKERPTRSDRLYVVPMCYRLSQMAVTFSILLTAAIVARSHMENSYSIVALIAELDCGRVSRISSSCFLPRPPPMATSPN